MKAILTCLWIAAALCSSRNAVHAQTQADSTSEFSRHLLVGTSLTYIWDQRFSTWQEYTFRVDLSYGISKYWYIGANLLNIWSGDASAGINHHWITGLNGRLNVVNDEDIRLFLESGLFYGNYCTCGDDIPYRRPGNVYGGLGAGMSIRIKEPLFLELGFHNYNILHKIPGDYSYNFTQYIIGLEYRIEGRR